MGRYIVEGSEDYKQELIDSLRKSNKLFEQLQDATVNSKLKKISKKFSKSISNIEETIKIIDNEEFELKDIKELVAIMRQHIHNSKV